MFFIRELEWLRASGVRAGSRDADVGFHDSHLSEGDLSSEIPLLRRLAVTPDSPTGALVRPPMPPPAMSP